MPLELMSFSLVSAIVITTASAPIPLNVELYGNLKSGMSKQEAEMVLSEDERFLTENCQMKIKKIYQKDRLISVFLRNKWALEKNDCYEPILLNLTEKYGIPNEAEDTPAIGNIIRAGFTVRWVIDKRAIELSKRGSTTILHYKTATHTEVEKIDNL